MEGTTSANAANRDSSGPADEHRQLEPYLRPTDFVWIVSFVFMLGINVWFGIHNYAEIQKVASTQKNAEALLAWITEQNKIRERGQPIPPECDGPAGTWHECLASTLSATGPFHTFENLLQPKGKIFSDSCERGDLSTLGAIVIEKGNPKPLDPSALVYTKMPPTLRLNERLALRVFVCARSFHPMHIGETVL